MNSSPHTGSPERAPVPKPLPRPERPRKQLARSELKRSGFLERREPLPPVNRKRAKERRAVAFGDHATRIRALPCCVEGDHFGATEAAHVRTRGAGGTAKDLVPLCTRHHWQSHQIGIETFQRKYGIDLAAIAAELWENR